MPSANKDFTVEKSLNTVRNHKLTIVYDNNENRHLRFFRPESSDSWFELITWKGCLCINGDYGTYVFSRVDDMFGFFRRDKLSVNTGYWAEKLRATDKNDGHANYSQQVFDAEIKEYFDSHFEGSGKERKECWRDIGLLVLGAENGYEAHDRANEFKYKNFRFTDFWEHNVEEYSYYYMWCLHAIVWGVMEYDKNKAC